ncbi:MAG: MFS transporter [Burkholderiales bacterium]|nr:MFS transporter [Burkholderiales bacterium]
MAEAATGQPPLEQRRGGAAAWLVWGVAVAFVIYLFSFQTGYSIVNAAVRKDVGLSVVQVGLVAAAYTWSFAVFQLFSGALLDRLGARRVLPPAIALVTLGVFVFAHAGAFETLIAAQLILALGACAGFVGAGYVGGQWFGMANFSVMFGLVQCLASAFSAFSQNLIGFALQYASWRELFDWIGAFGIVLLGVGLAFIRDPAPVRGIQHGIVAFLREVVIGILEVARIGHVWIAAAYGALCFGALLAAGVVWAPKLILVRGLPESTANLAASVLWLGLAVGCILVPRWSDAVRLRKLPAMAGIGLQLAALLALVYAPGLPSAALMALWFLFGLGAAAHMLAFSAAGDVVSLDRIGTSAAIVNGTMFLVSGLLIARPGQIAADAVAAGAAVTMTLAMEAFRPLTWGLVAALVLAALIRESYPRTRDEG